MTSPSAHAESAETDPAELLACFDRIKRRLATHAGGSPGSSPPASPVYDSPPGALAGRPPALDRLTEAFALSPFERDTLLLCAGVELDGELPRLCAAAQGDPTRPYPTFGLALAALPEPHWSALSADAPLRRWRLIEAGAGQSWTRAPLRIDERVLNFLVGVPQLDERLSMLLEPLSTTPVGALAPSQAVIAERVADVWAGEGRGSELPLVQLNGAAADCRPIAAAAATLLGLGGAILPLERLPTAPAELDALLRLWERESALSGLGVLMLEGDDNAPAEGDWARSRAAALDFLLERTSGPLILREREPRRITIRPAAVIDAPHPTTGEQLEVWRDSVGGASPETNATLAAAAAQFSLSPLAIRAIAAEAHRRATASPPADLGDAVWELCRRRLRTALDGLAERIESRTRLERPRVAGAADGDAAPDRGAIAPAQHGPRAMGVRREIAPGSRPQRAVPRAERHGEDDGGGGAGRRPEA